jgi:hypothetical protein
MNPIQIDTAFDSGNIEVLGTAAPAPRWPSAAMRIPISSSGSTFASAARRGANWC